MRGNGQDRFRLDIWNISSMERVFQQRWTPCPCRDVALGDTGGPGTAGDGWIQSQGIFPTSGIPWRGSSSAGVLCQQLCPHPKLGPVTAPIPPIHSHPRALKTGMRINNEQKSEQSSREGVLGSQQ